MGEDFCLRTPALLSRSSIDKFLCGPCPIAAIVVIIWVHWFKSIVKIDRIRRLRKFRFVFHDVAGSAVFPERVAVGK